MYARLFLLKQRVSEQSSSCGCESITEVEMRSRCCSEIGSDMRADKPNEHDVRTRNMREDCGPECRVCAMYFNLHSGRTPNSGIGNNLWTFQAPAVKRNAALFSLKMQCIVLICIKVNALDCSLVCDCPDECMLMGSFSAGPVEIPINQYPHSFKVKCI